MKHLSLILLSVIFCSSCLDQVDNYYPDYISIVSENYDKSGWIPESTLPPSTSNLYSRTNLDINSFMIMYQVSNDDVELIKNLLISSNQVFVKPHGINLPKWWPQNINELESYQLPGDSNKGVFAIDNNTIYYWGKFK